MKNLTPVAILLTTFNSEPFLTALIESILGQDNSDWTLFISDDGSSDKTPEILKYYADNLPDKIVLIGFPEKNVGASIAFERLLRHIDSPYYMFCDHDDIWLPYKISLTLTEMKAAELKFKKTPVLVHTDLTVVDRQLTLIAHSLAAFSKINPGKSGNYKFLTVANFVTGCTIMINSPAKQIILPIPNHAVMYDWWIALNVSRQGQIIYIPEPTILYRQHDQNVVGAKKAGILYFVNAFINFKQAMRADRYKINALRVFGDFGIIKYIYFKLCFQFNRYLR
jgi:glycosyltransferase involved in cell wall biosynthesis